MFDKAVFESLDRLCERPLIGTRHSYVNLKLDGLRMWFVKGFEQYLIFYRPFGNYIEVVRILHSAQDRYLALEEE